MKPILIAVSLLANAALVAAFAFKPALVPPAFRDYFTFGSGSAADHSATPASTAKSKPASRAAPLWTTLHTDNLAALVARLRAAGFPIYTIRAILQAEIGSRYDARIRALAQGDSDAPFWKSTDSTSLAGSRLTEYQQLINERSKLLRDLLGDFALRDDGDLTTAQRRQYGNLPKSKTDQIDRINQDYDELNREVRAAMNGITLPEDREKLALLAREKRADLSALLTPDELAEYLMRSSALTYRLRPAFDLFKVSEEEFRSIYAIQQAYNDRINPADLTILTLEDRRNLLEQRTTAQKELDNAMRAALGDQRFAEFTRASDREFQQLVRLTGQQNLPLQAAIDAYSLRDHLSQESNRIADDTTMAYDQKIAALQSLAQNTRAQLAAALGLTAGEAYLKTADRWLSNVERGSTITFTNNGYNSRGIPNPNTPGRGGAFSTSAATMMSAGGLFIGGNGSVIATPPNTSVNITQDGARTTITQSTSSPTAPAPTP